MTDIKDNIGRHFSKLDERSTIAPEEKSWLKLEKKLDRHRYKRNIQNYRNLVIAAVSLFIITFVLLMTVYTNNENLDSNIKNPETFVYQLNDLEAITDSRYTRRNIEILAEKYILAGIQ